MKKFDIESAGIEFKNIISGPAPVGRILNYIYLSGNSRLKHKNGNRDTKLNNNIGCAWTTELMIGLDLVCKGNEIQDGIYNLKLTKKGKELYNILKPKYKQFNEGHTKSDLKILETELNKNSPLLFDAYKNAFINSLPFQILKEYLAENSYIYNNKKDFIDDYFEAVKTLYDTDPTPYVRTGRTTAGENRVPSLLQHCMLFGLLKDENNTYSFNRHIIENLNIAITQREFTETELESAAQDSEDVIKELSVDELCRKYGIDGNQLITAVVRNSKLQAMFKNNLMISQGGKCLMCEIKNHSLLIASHIKPAAESNAYQKADYNNGLLLCCNHDKLFDRHLITFNFMDGQIQISKTLTKEDRKKLLLDSNFVLPKELLTKERKKYLLEHNTVFNNEESKR